MRLSDILSYSCRKGLSDKSNNIANVERIRNVTELLFDYLDYAFLAIFLSRYILPTFSG